MLLSYPIDSSQWHRHRRQTVDVLYNWRSWWWKGEEHVGDRSRSLSCTAFLLAIGESTRERYNRLVSMFDWYPSSFLHLRSKSIDQNFSFAFVVKRLNLDCEFLFSLAKVSSAIRGKWVADRRPLGTVRPMDWPCFQSRLLSKEVPLINWRQWRSTPVSLSIERIDCSLSSVEWSVSFFSFSLNILAKYWKRSIVVLLIVTLNRWSFRMEIKRFSVESLVELWLWSCSWIDLHRHWSQMNRSASWSSSSREKTNPTRTNSECHQRHSTDKWLTDLDSSHLDSSPVSLPVISNWRSTKEKKQRQGSSAVTHAVNHLFSDGIRRARLLVSSNVHCDHVNQRRETIYRAKGQF